MTPPDEPQRPRTPPHARTEPGITAGRIGGVPVVLGYSWLVLIAIVLVVLGPRLAASMGAAAGYGLAAGYAAVLLVSVLIHEAAHAVVGNRVGHRSERIVLTFLGGHTNLAGPASRRPRNRDLLLIALAGPAVNLLAALAGWLVLWALGSGAPSLGADLLWAFVWSNLLLGVFNLLPGMPLDGGQIVEAAVWRATGRRRTGTAASAWAGIVIGSGILAASLTLLLVGAPMSMFLGALATGGFIAYSAFSQLQRIPVLDFVERWDVFARTRPLAGTVRVTDRVPSARTGALLVVDESGAPVGCLDEFAAPGALASDEMRLVGPSVERSAGTPAAVEALTREAVWAIPVAEGGRIVGILTHEDLAITSDDVRAATHTPATANPTTENRR
ncbi:site-2 protease family protein [Falsarthrobacter nasiphocae]|uniref:Zn-dependent protease/CBS domain-containing protein n=1 Tax=Falsarthrobacter nasiphocae TaxID=189863 RepID=A0AAE4C486_9MICC|nr:site-2 protease family protein [Falsarthrobacter nasiphocae]MDR6891111.1 Zn-dependent protease/CBS domain-containing protein [Falsarthrobacter nasiphocae]